MQTLSAAAAALSLANDKRYCQFEWPCNGLAVSAGEMVVGHEGSRGKMQHDGVFIWRLNEGDVSQE